VRFELDGSEVTAAVRQGASLLELLRDVLGHHSMKDGCAPEGSCGACTVLVDGKPVVACAQPAERVAGRTVLTQQGLSPESRRIWTEAFVAAGGAQCGFCTPGVVMKATALLDRNAEPTRDDIVHALAGNTCRCTGYTKIIDAIQLAAAARRGAEIPAPDPTGRVGTSAARYQGSSSSWVTSRS
jgi:aldehyde oxidoreductase